MPHTKDQSLNQWMSMLDEIYGRTQNYSKSRYEILAHLSEVSGAFGKFMFKRRDAERAMEFLPKIFSWTLALVKEVHRKEANLEEMVLRKYPAACPYCRHSRCACTGQKSEIDPTLVQALYDKNSAAQPRRLNDFQAMFTRIYGHTWNVPEGDPTAAFDGLRTLYIRLIEELAEVAEATRFVHLYPSNFGNEVADFLAWWFALVQSIHKTDPRRAEQLQAADLTWRAYPGFCRHCDLSPCDCRPGPVRELLSKPALLDLAFIDALTQAANRNCFNEETADIERGSRPLALPAACIFVDFDDFKVINEKFDHPTGDRALKHVVSVIRPKLRARDRLYRYGGDEFVVLCPDLSAREAEGMMTRAADALRRNPMKVGSVEHPITLSIGIVECNHATTLRRTFDEADHAAKRSKAAGKDRITVSG
jgi:diguanylate cyclase (GGDEF)-like protein